MDGGSQLCEFVRVCVCVCVCVRGVGVVGGGWAKNCGVFLVCREGGGSGKEFWTFLGPHFVVGKRIIGSFH